MQAIARALETAPLSSNTLIVRTDSQYSQNGNRSFLIFCSGPNPNAPHIALANWPYKWRQNGWKTFQGKPVLNKELIQYALALLETRQRSGQPVRLQHVRGHSGDIGNDSADALAVAGRNLSEIPERDWARLTETHNLEQAMMADLMDGVNLNVSPSLKLCPSNAGVPL